MEDFGDYAEDLLGDNEQTRILGRYEISLFQKIKRLDEIGYRVIKINSVLDDVKECLHPFNKVISGDEGDFCTECQKYLKTNRL